MSEPSDAILKEIDSSSLKIAIDNKETFIVEFSADWCHPCKLLQPTMEELAKEHTNIPFYKIDVDSNNDVLDEYNIGAVPTVMFYGNGENLLRVKGYQKKENIEEAIQKSLGPFLQ